MKFGFMVPRESDFDDGGDPYPRIYEYCQRAEELGFDFATFTHHRFTPDRPYLSSPFVIMSAVAAQTQRLELMTTIFILPLYHPLDVAESAAALDLLSGGRLVLKKDRNPSLASLLQVHPHSCLPTKGHCSWLWQRS